MRVGKWYGLQHWLNGADDGDAGTIKTRTRLSEHNYNHDELKAFQGELDIRDCSREIGLSFNINPRNERHRTKWYKARKKKLGIIRKHLDFLEKSLDEWYDSEE